MSEASSSTAVKPKPATATPVRRGPTAADYDRLDARADQLNRELDILLERFKARNLARFGG